MNFGCERLKRECEVTISNEGDIETIAKPKANILNNLAKYKFTKDYLTGELFHFDSENRIQKTD